MRYRVTSPPAEEPVSLAAAKLHLRVDGTNEDELITNLITAAREYSEGITGRALAIQTINAYPDNFGDPLPRPPLNSVDSVTYTDSSGEVHTLEEGENYLVDLLNEQLVPPSGKSWPSFTPYPVNPICVEYKAGYAKVPKTVYQAMLLLIGHWYANREAVGTASGELELAVKALLKMHRARW